MKPLKIGQIFFAIFLSFIIAGFLDKNVFLSSTPKINTFYFSQIPKRIKDNIFSAQNKLAGLFQNGNKTQTNSTDILANTVLKKTSKGVYGGEDNGTKIYSYVQDEINWKEYKFTLTDGRVITINVPESNESPSQEDIQAVYGK